MNACLHAFGVIHDALGAVDVPCCAGTTLSVFRFELERARSADSAADAPIQAFGSFELAFAQVRAGRAYCALTRRRRAKKRCGMFKRDLCRLRCLRFSL